MKSFAPFFLLGALGVALPVVSAAITAKRSSHVPAAAPNTAHAPLHSFAKAAPVAALPAASDDTRPAAAARADSPVERLALVSTHASIVGFQREDGADAGYAIHPTYAGCQPTERAFKYATFERGTTSGTAPRGFTGDARALGEGFEELRAALERHKLTVADLHLEFGAFALEETTFPLDDVKNSPRHSEVRHYRNTSWRVRVAAGEKGHTLPIAVSGGPATLTITHHHHAPDRCNDDRIEGHIDLPVPTLVHQGNAIATDVGNAFMRDLSQRPVRVTFRSIQPDTDARTFRDRGSVGTSFRMNGAELTAITATSSI
jgi:hypothetical protein